MTKSQYLTDSAGNVVSVVGLDANRSSNRQIQPHRYTSYERDSNSGDEAMFRRYESKWARFSQPDPADFSYDLTDPQSLNRYSYTQNDPVNFIDPTGLLWGTIPTGPCPPGQCTVTVTAEEDYDASGGGGGSMLRALAREAELELRKITPQDNRTDCQRFADMVQDIAGRAANANDFLDEMARTFTAANNSTIGEMMRNSDNALPAGRPSFGDSGFQSRFQDGSNQVRHFVGGLIVGYRIGYEALPLMDARELLPGGTMADVRLNEYSMRWGASLEPRPASVTGYMGAIIRTPEHPGYRGLADLIRRDICQR